MTKPEIIAEFNQTFGYTFPDDSSTQSVSTMYQYAALRGHRALASKLQTLLPSPAGNPSEVISTPNKSSCGTEAGRE